ncbi:DUF3667 domain-containing protein [Leptobacterium sp. I13]|uniref:DUF3667 domain-containing protein n=1 Tax=Leptobacterium meishanense TaxID=3128904 RepID=UPI0030EDD5FA
MKEKQTFCRNCEASFNSTFSYCPYCGQKSDDELTIGVLFSNTISNYFSVDARFFRSFFPLLFRPGYLAKKFVEGKRLRYLHPAQYYLFVSVVFFFLFSIVISRQQQEFDKVIEKAFVPKQTIDSISKKDSVNLLRAQEIVKNQKEKLKELDVNIKEDDLKKLDSILESPNQGIKTSFNMAKLDSLIAAGASKEEKLAALGLPKESKGIGKFLAGQGLKLYEQKGGGILKTFYDTIPISMFFLLPIFALLLKIFYLRRGHFAHHIVFSFYFFTFLFIVFSIILLANFIVNIPDWVDYLIVFSTVFYLFLAMKHFYEQGYFITFIKLGLLSFTYFMFILPFSFIIMLLIAFSLY